MIQTIVDGSIRCHLICHLSLIGLKGHYWRPDYKNSWMKFFLLRSLMVSGSGAERVRRGLEETIGWCYFCFRVSVHFQRNRRSPRIGRRWGSPDSRWGFGYWPYEKSKVGQLMGPFAVRMCRDEEAQGDAGHMRKGNPHWPEEKRKAGQLMGSLCWRRQTA